MKTIGLLGGMSWESTALYYKLVNEEVRARLGGLHSAKILLYSVDFQQIALWQQQGEWQKAGHFCAQKALMLREAGADGIVLCTNTMHTIAPMIEAAIDVPLLHIVGPTATAIKRRGLRRIGFLGTRFTMEQPFYTDRLRQQYGLEVLLPGIEDREIVHQIIFNELCRGEIIEASRRTFRRIMHDLTERGAEGIILGCTEIAMLVKPDDASVPLFDTTALHAKSVCDWALAGEGA
ncbi:MAG: aspartate/glutamate racemase family protein [Proteobacteria bacterium]|nr:aspartate/glutamate racemase family protein [Pseudomonadota bacterium]